ncbi:MAG: CDP-diacylglycerol--serine O-phosphatidyltransferase [Rikenellaceae bacterium]
MGIKRHIPNAITSLNLLFGTIAVIFAFEGYQVFAIYLILLAAVCDFLDGFAARLFKVYSPMGKELDSLADLVSFGLAPTILLYHKMDELFGSQISGSTDTLFLEFLMFVPVSITIASALRLAKFNVDTRQSENFIGLPTPANALLICMFMHFSTYNTLFDGLLSTTYFIPAVSLTLSFLLVSNIPMFSLKFKSLKWRGNGMRYLLIITAFILLVAALVFNITWSVSLLIVFCLYLFINIFIYLINCVKR